MKAFIQRHPVLSYFIMTYFISWGAALAIVAPNLLQRKVIPQLDGLLMFPLLLLGPSISGIALTAIVDGRPGLRQLRSRLFRWRVPGQWYVVILLPPALIIGVLLTLHSLVSPIFAPHFMILGITYGIVPGFLEEIGWMGFAFPHLQSHRSTLSASLILGGLWGLWHLPVIDFLGAAWPHGVYWPAYALAFVVAMIAMRVLIVWVYVNTKSIVLPQVLHISSTASLVIFSPVPILPAQEALWYACYAVALWVVVTLVILIYSPRLVRTRRTLVSAEQQASALGADR